MPSRTRRVAGAAVVIAVLALTGCVYQPDFALRLNADGTLDFGTCETIRSTEGMTATAYVRGDDGAQPIPLILRRVPPRLAVGDVVHLGPAPPADRWDRISVTTGSQWSGEFDSAGLMVGTWQWARSSSLLSDGEHCALPD